LIRLDNMLEKILAIEKRQLRWQGDRI